MRRGSGEVRRRGIAEALKRPLKLAEFAGEGGSASARRVGGTLQRGRPRGRKGLSHDSRVLRWPGNL